MGLFKRYSTMLTKILVTAAVIMGCYFYLRFKRNRNAIEANASHVRLAEPKPAVVRSLKSMSPVRLLALGLCLLSVLSSAAYLGSRWLDDRVLLQVRVVNASSGESTDYQAYKGDVEGRVFITIYGQRVSIADTERMEISEVRPD